MPINTLPKYVYANCKRETLEKLAAASEIYMAKDTSPFGRALLAVHEEALVKTRADYDAEIGELLREGLDDAGCLSSSDTRKFKDLVAKSREAK